RSRNHSVFETERGGARREFVRRSRGGIPRYRQPGQQEDFALVAVIDQRTRRQRAWPLPLYSPAANAFGKLPRDRGGQPGVSGIAPVGVPAFGHLEAQRERDR